MNAPLRGRLVLRVYGFALVTFVGVLFALILATRFSIALAGDFGWAKFILEEVTKDRAPDAWSAELARLEKGAGLRMALYDENGGVIASSAAAPAGPDAAERAKLREHPVLVRVLSDGIIVAIDRPPAAYGTVAPRPPLLRAWVPALLAALVLSLLVVASFVFARSLARPLSRLAAAARAIGDGDLTARTGVDRRDEIGSVARAIDEMAARLDVLVRAQKELLANVSHELRTPLARIQVALDIAAEGDVANAKASLAEIAEDLGELERLVADLLATSRLDLATPGGLPMLQRRASSVSSLIEDAATRFRARHPRHAIEVKNDVGDASWETETALVQRAIDNLLDNAAKYSEPGTTVHLRGRVDATRVTIDVEDHGIGIDAADLPHLFTPFFRTDRSRARKTGGVGLGLALCKKVVVAHGGTIQARSVAGTGSTFTVEIPRKSEPA